MASFEEEPASNEDRPIREQFQPATRAKRQESKPREAAAMGLTAKRKSQCLDCKTKKRLNPICQARQKRRLRQFYVLMDVPEYSWKVIRSGSCSNAFLNSRKIKSRHGSCHNCEPKGLKIAITAKPTTIAK